MPALNTDKVRKASNGAGDPVVTSLALPKLAGTTTAELTSATNWNTTTGVDVIMYRRQLNSSTGQYEKVANSQTDWVGVLTGTTLSGLLLKNGTEPTSGYAADGNTVVLCGPAGAWADDIATTILAHANQDGSLKTAAVQTALGLGASSLNGWNALAFTPNTVTYLGNRSYQCVFNSQDLTTTLSAGMRLRFTRTVAAPTQSTLLNGTNQYWSKTSPAGMAQTDNISFGGWVKPTAYQTSHVIAKTATAGTDGWRMYMGSDGRLTVNANGRFASAYLSLPLNKWSHVVATLALASNTVIFYVDGLAVASSTVSGAGTITAAGNLWVGARDSGVEPWAGELSQVFMASKVLSAAEVKAIYSQGFTADDMTTYSIVSAFSFNGNANDINTTNANNLTSNNAAAATNADSPFGGQADGTNSSTLDYGIIQKAVYSGGNTTLTIQVPEGCTIPTTGTIASVAYSSNKAPYGMPIQRGKWVVSTTLLVQQSIAANASTLAFNVNIVVPVGEWVLGFNGTFEVDPSPSSSAVGFFGMNTTAAFDPELTVKTAVAASVSYFGVPGAKEKDVSLAAATTYNFYGNGNAAATSVSIQCNSTQGNFKMYAIPSYL